MIKQPDITQTKACMFSHPKAGSAQDCYCASCCEKRGSTIAFKLLRVRRNGTLGPLFINQSLVVEPGVWLEAEDHPTKGVFAHRPGWYCNETPSAPHLSTKGRAWYKVEIQDYYTHPRPKYQSGHWLIAKRMRVRGYHNAKK